MNFGPNLAANLVDRSRAGIGLAETASSRITAAGVLQEVRVDV